MSSTEERVHGLAIVVRLLAVQLDLDHPGNAKRLLDSVNMASLPAGTQAVVREMLAPAR